MLSARHYAVLAVSALPACGPVGAAAGDALAWRSQVLQLGEVIAGSQRAVSWDFVNDGGATRITVGEVSCACMNVELRLGSERLKRDVVISEGERKFFELFIRSFDGSVFKLPPQPDVAPPGWKLRPSKT